MSEFKGIHERFSPLCHAAKKIFSFKLTLGIIKIATIIKSQLENTTHCKNPRPFLLDKITCKHLFEFVITIA